MWRQYRLVSGDSFEVCYMEVWLLPGILCLIRFREYDYRLNGAFVSLGKAGQTTQRAPRSLREQPDENQFVISRRSGCPYSHFSHRQVSVVKRRYTARRYNDKLYRQLLTWLDFLFIFRRSLDISPKFAMSETWRYIEVWLYTKPKTLLSHISIAAILTAQHGRSQKADFSGHDELGGTRTQQKCLEISHRYHALPCSRENNFDGCCFSAHRSRNSVPWTVARTGRNTHVPKRALLYVASSATNVINRYLLWWLRLPSDSVDNNLNLWKHVRLQN